MVPAPSLTPLPRLGLDQLATAVLAVDEALCVCYLNPAAENLFAFSARTVLGQPLSQLFLDAGGLLSAVQLALSENTSYTEHELTVATREQSHLLYCTLTPLAGEGPRLLLEFHPIDTHVRIAREERMQLTQEFNRELLRNLAHEIKNPLGGIRGAAQLLEHELPRESLREYTQVIIKEALRLQSLMDRLLAPHRLPHFAPVNIHEVLERVRSLLLAEAQPGLRIRRDYDVSLPELWADQESLIQIVLNIARNAAQALEGHGEIVLRSRVSHRVHIGKRFFRMAAAVSVIDNGPGIPPELAERIFYPLVTTKAKGSGLGLTLAQNYAAQHQGSISFESRPGRTVFTVLLPYTQPESGC